MGSTLYRDKLLLNKDYLPLVSILHNLYSEMSEEIFRECLLVTRFSWQLLFEILFSGQILASPCLSPIILI